MAIRRSHHIGCLASFIEAPARRGYLVLVLCSDPSDAMVAPFGGTTAVMTPNPLAAGIPTGGDPILLDVSTSITTAGMSARQRARGERLPGPWLIDREGRPSDDPEVLGQGGALLPVGGLDHGHKGFALGLLVEALTQGLSGHGRADEPTGWGASVLVLAFAPRTGSAAAARSPARWTASSQAASPRPRRSDGLASRPAPRAARPRGKPAALRDGLELFAEIPPELHALAERLGRPPPRSDR